ncbi:GrpB family protein [Lentibacillus sp. JNUCC-1]|uniref:GrpB family protein n=1 Tax=Lentibacillus sp. JNUCC-1 TaxID=2654513 RepID=UPI0012E8C5EF
MNDKVYFRHESCFREDAAMVVLKHRSNIKDNMPYAEVLHVGSTAVAGALTKGDVDLQVRVPQNKFEGAKEVLKQWYSVNKGSYQSHYFCAFEQPDEVLPLGIQLTAIGSDLDHFWKLTYFFKEHPDYIKAYNAIKEKHNRQSMEKYREAKSAFIENIFSSPEYKAFGQALF